MLTPDVLVIGGGFAGMSAATALAAHGARVIVLESRAVLGGRATSHRDPVTGEWVDNGQHVLLGCYQETFQFLDRIDARANVRLQDRLEVTFADPGGRSTLRCPPLPAPLHLVAGLLTWPGVRLADRLSALRMWYWLRHPGAATTRPEVTSARQARGLARATLDGMTVTEWLTAAGQSRALQERFWNPLALAALNQPAEVSAAAPFVRVAQELFLGSRRAATIGLASQPLVRLFGIAAERYLGRRDGEVRRSTAASAIHLARGRVDAIETRSHRGTFKPGACIIAAAWHALPAFCPPEILDGVPHLAEAVRMPASPIVTANLWFDRAVLDAPFVGLLGTTAQWAFDKAAVLGPPARHLSVVISGAPRLLARSNADIVSLVVNDLRRVLPKARGAILKHSTVIRERQATFSLAPGAPTRPGTLTPIPNLFLAGDWTDTGLPATIEGAVLSGHRAAKAIIDRGWRPPVETAPSLSANKPGARSLEPGA